MQWNPLKWRVGKKPSEAAVNRGINDNGMAQVTSNPPARPLPAASSAGPALRDAPKAEIAPAPLTPERVISSQAEELKQHAATGQAITYVPDPAAVKLAGVRVVATANGHIAYFPPKADFPTEQPEVSETLDLAPNPHSATVEATLPKPAAVAAQPKEAPVATASVVPAKTNGFVSFFKKLGTDLAKILPVVEAVQSAPAVQAVESLAFGPAITSLVSTWVDRATTVEASFASAVGTAAASSSTNSLQKASIVINSMTPVAQQLATQLGASALTVSDMEIVNNAVIAIANVFKVPATTA